jgi:hypothetical protein
MHVPAQPDSDPDLVISEALRSAKKALIAARPQPESAKDVRELAADIRELQSQYEIGGSWCKLSLDEAAALIQSSFEAWERERQKTGLSDDAECRIVIRQINALTGIEDKVTFLQSFLASRQSASEPSEEVSNLLVVLDDAEGDLRTDGYYSYADAIAKARALLAREAPKEQA